MHYILLLFGCLVAHGGHWPVAGVVMLLAGICWLRGDVITDWIVHEFQSVQISNLWTPLAVQALRAEALVEKRKKEINEAE